ncbi:hypothetical protein Tco_1144560 [Tanacetum coccineum]
MYYPRFTKAIIHHFITKDKSISMRNIMFMHTSRDDNILGTMRFVSKSDDFQIFGAVLPNRMTNQQIRDSDAYKTYLAYPTGASSPKMKRKLKKPAYPSKKRTLVIEEEEEHEPAKKEKPTKKPATKRYGDEANEHSDDEDEQSDDNQEQADDERTESDDEEEETQDDEYIHTPDDYLYGYVNVSLTDDELTDKETDDEEMTVAGHVNVNQEGAGNQVNDDAQATQKTEGPILSSSISSDYAAKYLNFDNIPPKDVKELKDVDNSTKFISTIQSEVPKVVKEYLGSSLDDAMHKVIHKNIADIIKEHFVPAETVERHRQENAPQKSVEDIWEIKLEHARKQQVPKETITSSDTTALAEFDQKTTLFETMTKSKSFDKIPKQRALYHALMKLILEDEDAIHEGVADKL